MAINVYGIDDCIIISLSGNSYLSGYVFAVCFIMRCISLASISTLVDCFVIT